MHLTINVYDEVVKALITFVTVALLGGAAATLFARRRYRRELDMSAAARFYDVYGTWFSTWKQWSAVKKEEEQKKKERARNEAASAQTGGTVVAAGRDSAQATEDPKKAATRAELLKAAAACEGQFEALLIKIAIERRLRTPELDRMARFREGYQRLRECIEADVALPFSIQHRSNDRSAYVAFKSSSVEFAGLVSGRRRASPVWVSRILPQRYGRLATAQLNFIEMSSWRVAGSSKDLWWKDRNAKSSKLARKAWEELPHPWGKPPQS